jgi:hypothetical protein
MARPNDEERDGVSLPNRSHLARSSSSVSLSLGGPSRALGDSQPTTKMVSAIPTSRASAERHNDKKTKMMVAGETSFAARGGSLSGVDTSDPETQRWNA